MRKLALAVTMIGAAGLAACQAGTTTNNAADNDSVDVNGAAIGQSVENGLDSAGNTISRAGPAIENGLNDAGDALEAGWNEVRETARDVGGEAESSVNTADR